MTRYDPTPRYLERRMNTIRWSLKENVILPGLLKVDVLASIIFHGGGELQSEHFSGGSTVTRAGLRYACVANGVPLPEKVIKESLLGALLDHVGNKLLEGDVIKPGSTVRTEALLRVYRGLLRMELRGE